MKEKRSVSIVGGGFSGLVAAYFCAKKGCHVQLFEGSAKLGGIIDSVNDGYALSETAANGLLDTELLRNLAKDVGLDLLEPKSTAKARYIFRDGKARKWPLSFRGSLQVLWFLTTMWVSRKTLKPHSGETLKTWGERNLGAEATEYLLEPAMRGIYAGDIERLSASLLLQKLFSPKKSKSKRQKIKTVSPRHGMGEFATKIEAWLLNHGAEIIKGQPIQSLEELPDSTIILACGPGAASRLLQHSDPETTECLQRIEMSPVISVTLNFRPRAGDLTGFGCLFPRRESFHALGVLFNSDIFDHRSAYRSEKWILGGAQGSANLIGKSDDEIVNLLQEDRYRLTGNASEPLSVQVHRWPQALPHYTVELEADLPKIMKNRDISLLGNYLGRIGLSDIIAAAHSLAESIGEENVNSPAPH